MKAQHVSWGSCRETLGSQQHLRTTKPSLCKPSQCYRDLQEVQASSEAALEHPSPEQPHLEQQQDSAPHAPAGATASRKLFWCLPQLAWCLEIPCLYKTLPGQLPGTGLHTPWLVSQLVPSLSRSLPCLPAMPPAKQQLPGDHSLAQRHRNFASKRKNKAPSLQTCPVHFGADIWWDWVFWGGTSFLGTGILLLPPVTCWEACKEVSSGLHVT